MLLRTTIAAAAFAMLAAAPAFADDKADARANCMALGRDAIGAEQLPPDQMAMIQKGLDSMCTCMTDKIAGLGDDGSKVLRVLAKTTPEMAKASSESADGDRKNAIAVMVAEYGISEQDAGVIYDRVDPQVSVIGEQCQAEMMKAMSGPQ
jgi:hypothetical protein